MSAKVAPAFPSNPTRPTKYHVHVVDQDTNQRFSMGFYSLYAANIWINQFVKEIGEKVKWRDEKTFMCGSHMFKEDDLEKIMEYEPRGGESEWQMGDHEFAKILQFLGKSKRVADRQTQAIVQAAADEKPKKFERAHKREKRERAPKDGLTTVAQIAENLGVDARDARVALRKLKLEKPASGNWSWPAAEAKQIEAQIKKALK